MLFKFGLLSVVLIIAHAEDKKWVWDNNSRNAQSIGQGPGDKQASPRYEVFEDDDTPYRPGGFLNGPSYGENNYDRPDFEDRPFNNRPNRPGAGFIPNRPGGVYGSGGSGGYGQGQGAYPEEGILTGPVPSWEKQGPFKNYDRCKCTEKFNCNSPGISYGHCDVGKQYCCYSTKKIDQLGGPFPSRPIHSPENGVLVGPGGPFDGPGPRPPLGGGPRPPLGGGYRPGRPGFGLGGRPNNFGPVGNRPTHSIDNGILVGPGGPFDFPNRPGYGGGGGYGGYGGRSAKKE